MLITWTGRREHITPVQQELHWLLVQRCIEFKLATLMYKALHDTAPLYVSDECQLVSDFDRRLRSPAALSCHVTDQDSAG